MSFLRSKYVIIALITLFLLALGGGIVYFNSTPPSNYAVRAVIEVSSYSIKLKIASLNTKNHHIDRVVVNEAFDRENPGKPLVFTPEIMKKGIDSIKRARGLAKQYGLAKVVVIMDHNFKDSPNLDQFIKKVHDELGVKIYVLNQDLEGKLAYLAVGSQFPSRPSDLIIWEIGKEHFQFTTKDDSNEYVVLKGEGGIELFKKQVVSSPAAMSTEEREVTEKIARQLAEKIDFTFKERIQKPNVHIVGVGSLFSDEIFQLVQHKDPFTVDDLRDAIDANLDQPNITDAILVLGFMENLRIHSMHTYDVNYVDGALLYPPFWD